MNHNKVYKLNKKDSYAWDQFVYNHELGSIYHTTHWKNIIINTYGHTPIYLYSRNSTGKITAAVPLFLIKSKLLGDRLTSVPLGQACDPLATSEEDLSHIKYEIEKIYESSNCKYVEIKQMSEPKLLNYSQTNKDYCTHILDLNQSLDEIKSSFQKSCIRRPLKKLQNTELKKINGNDKRHLIQFYRLYSNMRKQKGLLPQPYSFFLNMWNELKDKNLIEILSAEYKGMIVSSALLLKYKNKMTYEYGATDVNMKKMNASHFVLWEAIKEAWEDGYYKFDFGRTDKNNEGLYNFKRRWGTKERQFYYNYFSPDGELSSFRENPSIKKVMNYVIHFSPLPICNALGGVLYKHTI